MSATAVSVWSPEPGLLSKGARWHEQTPRAFVGRHSRAPLHRATLTRDGQPGRIETVELDRDVGVVAPAAAQAFLFVDESGTVIELASLTDARSGVRFNDGACDERGRFWVGTMAYDKSPGAGALYRLELDGSISTVLTGLTILNGIGWSPDGAIMYPNDSGTGCLYEFDVDLCTGEPRNRRTLVAFEQPGPAPDGLTIDDRGDIRVAIYGGWAVHHYSPHGNSLARLNFRSPRQPRVRSAKRTAARCLSRPAASSATRRRLHPARRRTGVPGHGPGLYRGSLPR
jgi:sugar lactone lactonase YvrE